MNISHDRDKSNAYNKSVPCKNENEIFDINEARKTQRHGIEDCYCGVVVPHVRKPPQPWCRVEEVQGR